MANLFVNYPGHFDCVLDNGSCVRLSTYASDGTEPTSAPPGGYGLMLREGGILPVTAGAAGQFQLKARAGGNTFALRIDGGGILIVAT